jgi:hypothetical protein
MSTFEIDTHASERSASDEDRDGVEQYEPSEDSPSLPVNVHLKLKVQSETERKKTKSAQATRACRFRAKGVEVPPPVRVKIADPYESIPPQYSLMLSKPLILTEHIPPARAYWLLKHLDTHPEILTKAVADHGRNQQGFFEADNYTKACTGFLKAAASNKFADGQMEVKYSPSKHGYGRLFSSGNDKVGLQGLSRVLRQTLVEGIYQDFDAVNCFVVIIHQLAERTGLSLPVIQRYVQHREKLIAEIVAQDDKKLIDREFVKQSVLKVIFGGSVNPHPNVADKQNSCATYYTFMDSLKLEVSKQYAKLVNETPEGLILKKVVEATRKKNPRQYPNIHGGTISLLCQCVEAQCLLAWQEVLKANNVEVKTFCFDGFMAETGQVSSELLRLCEINAYRKTGIKLDLIPKAFASAIPIPADELAEIEAQWEAGELEEELEGFRAEEQAAASSNPGEVHVSCYGHRLTTDLIIWDNTEVSFVQAIDEFLRRLILAKVIMPVSAVDFSSYFCRKENGNLWIEDKIYMKYIISDWAGIIVKKIKGGDDGTPDVFIPMNKNKDFNEVYEMVVTRGAGIQREDRSAFDLLTAENTYKVFYRNGYFDLPTQRFVSVAEDPLASTFVRVESDFDVAAYSQLNEDHADVKEIRNNSLSCVGKDVAAQDYMLKIYARAIGGGFDKAWFMNIGGRSSGKGNIENMNKITFGQYCTTFSAPIVKNQNSDPGAANREVVTSNLHIARIATSNESSQDRVSKAEGGTLLDGMFLKNCASGGDHVKTRGMRQNELSLRVTAKLFINMNDTPRVEPADTLETAGLIHFPFKYEKKGKFASNLPGIITADPGIKQYFENNTRLHRAYTWLLFNAWRSEAVCEDDVPFATRMQFQAKFEDSLTQNNCLYSLFGRLFEIGEHTDYLSSNEVGQRFKIAEVACQPKKKKSYGEQDDDRLATVPSTGDFKRYAAFLEDQRCFVKKDKKINGKATKCWFGLKHKVVEKHEDEKAVGGLSETDEE